MSDFKAVLKSLDILVEYPDLAKYIKTFDGNGGFMFTTEVIPERIKMQKMMEDKLDPHGMHSGGSWGEMLRRVQAVLNGTVTREYVEQLHIEQEQRWQLWLAEQQEKDARKKQQQQEEEEDELREKIIN